MATVNRTISIPTELAERLNATPRSELPNVSKLVTRLLNRELDRLDAARARRNQKDKA